jgi:hypothetical protein
MRRGSVAVAALAAALVAAVLVAREGGRAATALLARDSFLDSYCELCPW